MNCLLQTAAFAVIDTDPKKGKIVIYEAVTKKKPERGGRLWWEAAANRGQAYNDPPPSPPPSLWLHLTLHPLSLQLNRLGLEQEIAQMTGALTKMDRVIVDESKVGHA